MPWPVWPAGLAALHSLAMIAGTRTANGRAVQLTAAVLQAAAVPQATPAAVARVLRQEVSQ